MPPSSRSKHPAEYSVVLFRTDHPILSLAATMTYAPQRPLDVPPYQLQSLVSGFTDTLSRTYPPEVCITLSKANHTLGAAGHPVTVRCAQAIGTLHACLYPWPFNDPSPGSEIYVGCSNGELLRFALQGNATDIVCASALRMFSNNLTRL